VIRLILLFLLVFLLPVQAHDPKHHEFDNWYEGLQRPNGMGSCCNIHDCHTTNAEIRQGDWWAQIGMPKDDGTWDLLDWVKIPSEVVLQHNNPTGEAVICHSLQWVGSVFASQAITIYCFIPPSQS